MLFSGKPADSGYTLLELTIVFFVIALLAGVAVISFYFYTTRAYNIIAKYDLKNFIQAEETYRAAKSFYLGESGDFIESGESSVGSLLQPGFKFTPSDGVRIEIVSGNGAANPSLLKIESSHRKGNVIYAYDMASKTTAERNK